MTFYDFLIKLGNQLVQNNLIFGTKYVQYSKYHNPMFDLELPILGTLDDYVNVCKNAQSPIK